VENHVLRHPDAVLDMEPLHAPILELFSEDARFFIGLQLTFHGIEQLADALKMALTDLALTITGLVVGGPVGLAIGAAATAHGVAQSIEAFEQVSLMEAMTELDVYGELALATPEMVASARKWAWIGAGLQTVLASPDLAQLLKVARADFGDAARAVGKTERELARELAISRGADRVRLVDRLRDAVAGRELTRWERSLSKETQDLFKSAPRLRTRFGRLSPAARRILTRCGSLCIPPGLTDAQCTRIEDFLVRAQRMTGRGGTRFGDTHEWLLREHFYGRRADIDQAIDLLERVANLNGLEATLRRAVSERSLAMRAESYTAVGAAVPALPAEPSGPLYKGTIEAHGAQRPAAEGWERATQVRRRGGGGVLLPHGQWYDDRFIIEAQARANASNAVPAPPGSAPGRTRHDFDMEWPVGRVFMPNRTVISDTRRVRVILEGDGTFVNAFPIPPTAAPAAPP
jgi:hypothetical protein